jgi:hypothetical protein
VIVLPADGHRIVGSVPLDTGRLIVANVLDAGRLIAATYPVAIDLVNGLLIAAINFRDGAGKLPGAEPAVGPPRETTVSAPLMRLFATRLFSAKTLQSLRGRSLYRSRERSLHNPW